VLQVLDEFGQPILHEVPEDEVTDGHRLFQEKDRQIQEKIYKIVELCNELDKPKHEHPQETWLLKQDIKNLEASNKVMEYQNCLLEHKNKSLAKIC